MSITYTYYNIKQTLNVEHRHTSTSVRVGLISKKSFVVNIFKAETNHRELGTTLSVTGSFRGNIKFGFADSAYK